MPLLKPTAEQPSRQPPDAPVMAIAINLTLRAIEDRARLYRGLIVVVSGTSVLALILAGLLRSWTPLLAFGLLVPLAGGYLLLDGRRVSRWRTEILDLWCRRDLKLALLAKSVSAYPSVPSRTLEGMLATLPPSSPDQKLDALAELEKRKLAGTSSAASRRQELRTLVAVAALTLAVALAAGAAQFRSVRMLLGSVFVVAVWAAVKNHL